MAKVGALTITPQPPIHIIPIMPSSVAGDWAYLATNPLERARLGVIYSSFYQPLASKHHLLDVGCGEGGLSDLFPRCVTLSYHLSSRT